MARTTAAQGSAAQGTARGAVRGRVVRERSVTVAEDGTVTTTYEGVPNVRVAMYADADDGGPGGVLGTTLTDDAGRFRLGRRAVPVRLEVVPPQPPARWQAGWYAGPQPERTGAGALAYHRSVPPSVVLPAGDLGDVGLMHATGAGRVRCGRRPVRDATVTYLPPGGRAASCVAVTGRKGRYRVTRLDHDEYLVKVSADGYVGGYVAGDGRVVRRAVDAVTFAGGDLPVGIAMVRIP